MGDAPSFEAWTCPLPLTDYPRVVLGHGGGGRLSAEIVEHLFVPAFSNPALDAMADAAVVAPPPPGPLVVTTDSFVVRPLVFPGGSIGELAVNGTVNDLAMVGAIPHCLTAGFIIEEGLEMAALGAIAARMAAAARRAGVRIVAGDTKVVERGHGDGLFITTTGVGVIPAGVDRLGPDLARPGDRVILSGTIGDHGIAVMSVRDDLGFEAAVRSDTAPLTSLVQALAPRGGRVRVLRDPTRGGLATTLNEIARQSRVGMLLHEAAIPLRAQVEAWHVTQAKAAKRLRTTQPRLNDLLREVKRQLTPLQRQAEAAQKHGGVVGELRAIRLHLAGHQIAIEPVPASWMVDPNDPARTPPDLLGLFVGDSELERTELDTRDTELRTRLRELDDAVVDAQHSLTALGGDGVADWVVRVEALPRPVEVKEARRA